MASDKALETYLNDHLAGATAGVDLARKLAGDTAGTPAAPFLEGLVAEIDADRGALEEVMERLEVERQTTKQAGGWLTEKVGRLRFTPSLTGSRDVSRLMEMDALSVGIHGKRSLWEAIRHTHGSDPRLAGVDLETLAKRAGEQVEGLEPHRLDVAARTLAG
jgi:hypothetical protein